MRTRKSTSLRPVRPGRRPRPAPGDARQQRAGEPGGELVHRLRRAALTATYRTVGGGTPRRGRTIGSPDVAHAMLSALSDPGTVGRGVGVAY